MAWHREVYWGWDEAAKLRHRAPAVLVLTLRLLIDGATWAYRTLAGPLARH